ncbi:unnamed protein product, partial [Candidula unifasciata]
VTLYTRIISGSCLWPFLISSVFMYYFAESFSLCVSVLLLTVIAVERYTAVMHPLRVKGLFTNCRMQAAQISIWVFAAVYNIPLVAIFDTFEMSNGTGDVIVFCNIREGVINLKLYFTINFILWYTLPLVTMSVAYAIISWTLWHSGTIFSQHRSNDPSYYSSIKMAPLNRENRLEGDMKDNGGKSDGSLCRHGNGSIGWNLCDVNDRYYIHYANDTSDGVRLNGEDKSSRGGTVTTSFPGTKSDMFVSGQTINHMYEYNPPVCWSWPAREDTGRDATTRNFRNTTCASRISGNHISQVETNGLTSTCLLYQKTHSKRQNGVINQTVPIPNIKLRPTRHSFHSDYASDSSVAHTPTCDAGIHKSQASTSERVLSSRRKVVRLLVLVLLTFGVCVLPHHIRLLMFYWNVYPEATFGFSFFPPLAFMCLYLNSALNPVLYSLFSESFRRSLRECLRRPWHRGKSFVSKHVVLCFRRSHHRSSDTMDIEME